MLKMSLKLSVHAPGSSGFWCLALDVTISIASLSNLLPLEVNKIAPFWYGEFIYLPKNNNEVR
jgi:hypothetical protein